MGLDEGLELLRSRVREPASTIVTAVGAAEGLILFGQVQPDLVIVSAALTGIDLPAAVAAMRQFGDCPILIACSAEETAVAGAALLRGATGVVERPINAAEVRQHLEQVMAMSSTRGGVLRYGPIQLDRAAFRVLHHGTEMDLPLKEFELLALLMQRSGEIVSPDQIRQALWGSDALSPGSNAITVHVSKLRARLGADALIAIRGQGYRLLYTDSCNTAAQETASSTGMHPAPNGA